MMNARFYGAVRWYDATKGYGFLSRDDGQADVFVHVSQVQRAGLDTLREGQRVEFSIGAGRADRTSAVDLVLRT